MFVSNKLQSCRFNRLKLLRNKGAAEVLTFRHFKSKQFLKTWDWTLRMKHEIHSWGLTEKNSNIFRWTGEHFSGLDFILLHEFIVRIINQILVNEQLSNVSSLLQKALWVIELMFSSCCQWIQFHINNIFCLQEFQHQSFSSSSVLVAYRTVVKQRRLRAAEEENIKSLKLHHLAAAKLASLAPLLLAWLMLTD